MAKSTKHNDKKTSLPENFENAVSKAMKFEMPKPKYKPRDIVRVIGQEGKLFEVIKSNMKVEDLRFVFLYILKEVSGSDRITAYQHEIKLP
ncbi:hypothetical protein [Edaphocola flava]|uniref:hypothetical protein n=1 Tax=Edaphocola flava TaxID=2499629 RepID=UPI00100A3AD4|nr:hypothetical protein [Edaphocola flava]